MKFTVDSKSWALERSTVSAAFEIEEARRLLLSWSFGKRCHYIEIYRDDAE